MHRRVHLAFVKLLLKLCDAIALGAALAAAARTGFAAAARVALAVLAARTGFGAAVPLLDGGFDRRAVLLREDRALGDRERRKAAQQVLPLLSGDQGGPGDEDDEHLVVVGSQGQG